MTRPAAALLILTCLLLAAGPAVGQTIDQIQDYDPATGAPTSPYDGMIVNVQGTVFVTAGTYDGGTHYLLGATGGICLRTVTSPSWSIGDYLDVIGTVATTPEGEICLVTPVVSNLGAPGEPPATPVAIGDLVHPFDYEQVGNFIECFGTVQRKEPDRFILAVAGDSLRIEIDPETDIDIGGVGIGEDYLVRGPCSVISGEIVLRPRHQTDLIENPGGDSPPIISDVACVDWFPEAGDPLVVQARITDDLAVIAATLYYRDSSGGGGGPFSSVPMVWTIGDTYQGTVPPPHTLEQVDFYVEADDGVNLPVTFPGAAPAVYVSCAIGFIPIHDMQWVQPDTTQQSSPYVGRPTNVRGVVTADTFGDPYAGWRFVIQDYDPDAPGDYDPRWTGVMIQLPDERWDAYRADGVMVAGLVYEADGLTVIEPYAGGIELEGWGYELPPPARAKTEVLANDDPYTGDGALGEAYECVWVRSWVVEVKQILGDGTFLVTDSGDPADGVMVQPRPATTYEPALDDCLILEGFMNYEYDAFRLTPLDDLCILSLTAVPEGSPDRNAAGGFTQVAPNPFNPRTVIAFELVRPERVQLSIVDLRGRLVRTLVGGTLPAGEHRRYWDGADDAGRQAASGLYVARLRIGTGREQLRKLTLVR